MLQISRKKLQTQREGKAHKKGPPMEFIAAAAPVMLLSALVAKHASYLTNYTDL